MIVLALVASGSTVLAETHDEEHARFLSAAETVLTRIQPNEASRLSYAYESWLFHYVADSNGLVFLCAADGEMGRRLPFGFLADVQKKVRRGEAISRARRFRYYVVLCSHPRSPDPLHSSHRRLMRHCWRSRVRATLPRLCRRLPRPCTTLIPSHRATLSRQHKRSWLVSRIS